MLQDNIVNEYMSRGADKAKIIVGIPFYGQSFTTRGESAPGSPSSGPGAPGAWTKQPGMLGYYEICQKLKSGWMSGSSQGPYAYETESKQWVGFDDVNSVKRKSEYVLQNGFAGVSVSTLDLDDFNNLCCQGAYPLLSSISEVLLRTAPAAPGCGRPAPPVTPAPIPQESTEPWDDGSNKKKETTQWTPASPTTTSSTTPATTTTTTSTTPVTTAALTAPVAPECVEGEFLASSSSCHQYYRCIDGRKMLHACAGGLAWDPVNLRCDWADTVNCLTRDGKEGEGRATLKTTFLTSSDHLCLINDLFFNYFFGIL